MADDILKKISPDEALEIVRKLAKTDRTIKDKIIKLAKEILGTVDAREICKAVYGALNSVDVHELWDRSGKTRYGYHPPDEVAYDMFEEAIAPYLANMHRLIGLKMIDEARVNCMGLLQGIYRFEQESRSEFSDWAIDIPCTFFDDVLRDWLKNAGSKEKKEMQNFIKKECPEWYSIEPFRPVSKARKAI